MSSVTAKTGRMITHKV